MCSFDYEKVVNQASKQMDIHTHAQCSTASVGPTQAHPYYALPILVIKWQQAPF